MSGCARRGMRRRRAAAGSAIAGLWHEREKEKRGRVGPKADKGVGFASDRATKGAIVRRPRTS